MLTAVRKFNIEGPIIAEDHYHVPPLGRVNVDEILEMIRDKRYFVLHAPRQTGKTSALLALRDLLNSGDAGDFRCVYVNVEPAQAMREAVEPAMRVILGALASRARSVAAILGEWVRIDMLTRFRRVRTMTCHVSHCS